MVRQRFKVYGIAGIALDPVHTFDKNGNPMSKLRLKATYTSRGEKLGPDNPDDEKDSCFITAFAVGQNAEFAREYLWKGRNIYFEGTLRMTVYEDPKTGRHNAHWIKLTELSALPFSGGQPPDLIQKHRTRANIASAPDKMAL